MNWTNRIAGLTVAALALGATSANAQIATGNLGVTISINAGCTITSITDVNFGNQTNLTTNVDADGNVGVTCTPGLKYKLGLALGQNGDRFMKRTNGADLIDYELYLDAARTTVFPDNGAGVVGGTGDGTQQNFPVYGRVPGGQGTPATGVYTDTVAVTVVY